jgi:hypothetical protein
MKATLIGLGFQHIPQPSSHLVIGLFLLVLGHNTNPLGGFSPFSIIIVLPLTPSHM